MEDTHNTANDPATKQDRALHEPATSYRDLGTAGGGTIPKGGTGNPPGGMSTSNSTINGSASSGAVGGAGETSDRGSQTDENVAQQMPEDQGATHNTVEGSGQSNIGGRNPGQSQTSMGSRDARSDPAQREHKNTGDDIMSARTPDKVSHEDKKQGQE